MAAPHVGHTPETTIQKRLGWVPNTHTDACVIRRTGINEPLLLCCGGSDGSNDEIEFCHGLLSLLQSNPVSSAVACLQAHVLPAVHVCVVAWPDCVRCVQNGIPVEHVPEAYKLHVSSPFFPISKYVGRGTSHAVHGVQCTWVGSRSHPHPHHNQTHPPTTQHNTTQHTPQRPSPLLGGPSIAPPPLQSGFAPPPPYKSHKCTS